MVSGRFINGYLKTDTVLLEKQGRQSLTHGWTRFAGCNSLHAVPGIENVSMERFVTAHYRMPPECQSSLHICSRTSIPSDQEPDFKTVRNGTETMLCSVCQANLYSVGKAAALKFPCFPESIMVEA